MFMFSDYSGSTSFARITWSPSQFSKPSLNGGSQFYFVQSREEIERRKCINVTSRLYCPIYDEFYKTILAVIYTCK
jgi:hypothetical protein